MMKTLLGILLSFTLVNPALAATKSAKRATQLHKQKTQKYAYDFSKINTLPFTFHELGMSDAEFFITDRPSDDIQNEIDRIQGSLSEIEYTTSISYEPKYLNKKPQSKTQKKSYLSGYLKVLEEAIL